MSAEDNDQHADHEINQAALYYHAKPRPGKISVEVSKPASTQRDLALAYSPGVAEASMRIAEAPEEASLYTSRANLVAVVSNGTAVLGLGNIGALASKPVMEGKAVLFKKFANIDCFDIEVNESDPEKLADIVCALEPTFGAINLEDIKAPDCFVVERICRERNATAFLVTHSLGEAVILSDRSLVMKPRPGRIVEDVRIDLPRPRTLEMINTPYFGEIVSHIRDLLGKEAHE